MEYFNSPAASKLLTNTSFTPPACVRCHASAVTGKLVDCVVPVTDASPADVTAMEGPRLWPGSFSIALPPRYVE